MRDEERRVNVHRGRCPLCGESLADVPSFELERCRKCGKMVHDDCYAEHLSECRAAVSPNGVYEDMTMPECTSGRGRQRRTRTLVGYFTGDVRQSVRRVLNVLEDL